MQWDDGMAGAAAGGELVAGPAIAERCHRCGGDGAVRLYRKSSGGTELPLCQGCALYLKRLRYELAWFERAAAQFELEVIEHDPGERGGSRRV